MKSRFVAVAFALVCASLTPAQEGHPLVGTWHGSWGPAAENRNDVTLVMSYDGKKVTALLNPGPDSIQIPEIALEPANWSIHFDVDTKDRSGRPVHVAAEGKIENITNARRWISGTWAQGTSKGSFKITRDN